MLKKYILLTFFVSILVVAKSQELSEEKRVQVVGYMYKTYSSLSTADSALYKVVPFDRANTYSSPFSDTQLASCLSKINQSKTLTAISFFNKYHVQLKCELGQFENSGLNDQIDISISENNLTINGQPLELLKFYNNQSSSNSIKQFQQIKNQEIDTSQIGGSATYALDFLKAYDTLKLDRSFIGKTITLNGQSVRIVQIMGNRIVLDGKIDNLKCINYVEENKVAKSYSFTDLKKINAKRPADDQLKMSFSPSQRSSTVYQSQFDLFQNNPDMDLEEYTKIMTLDKLKELKDSPKYTVIHLMAPVGDSFTFAVPIYTRKLVTLRFSH